MSASTIRFEKAPATVITAAMWWVIKTAPPLWVRDRVGEVVWSRHLSRYVFVVTTGTGVEFDEGDLLDIAQHLDHETSAVRRARRHK